MILINAQNNRIEKLGVFARYVPLGIPVGVASLAAYLIEKGHHVKLWDEAIRMLTIEDIRQLAEECGKPYVFGISCLTASIFRGYTIARMIREIFPDAKIVFGGMHPTVLPEEVLNTGLVDFVIVKEGEVPLDKLYRALKSGLDYEDINNLSFKKNGGIIHNPTEQGPPMELLPPFPYHLFEKYMGRYHFGFVVGSRGCPFNCIFCSQRSITGRRFTARNSDRIVDDIELLVNKYNQRLVIFSDDNMLTNKRRIRELCALIQERGLHKKTAFECQVRGDDINEDILKLLKATNFVSLDFGLETASERLMKIIEKKETVKANINALELATRYGFQLSGTFILGLPTETKEERLQSYKLARKYLDNVRFNNATPYPGTKLYEIAKEEGRLDVGKDWENLNACGTLVEGAFSNKRLAYVPIGTTEIELKKDILKYNLCFSFRWKVIRNLLDHKKAAAGWFLMPARWYLDYREWEHLTWLGFNILQKWAGLFALMFISKIVIVKSFLSGKDSNSEN